MNWKLVGAAAMALALAGCGTEPKERTTGGAAAGAATGAAVGALGGPVGVGVGALVGAGAGAATGAATTPQQVNLGKPVWDNPEAQVGGRHLAGNGQASGQHAAGSPRVRRLQERLERAGYNPGPIDGVMGPQTRRALREYRGGTHGGRTPRATHANPGSAAGSSTSTPAASTSTAPASSAPATTAPASTAPGSTAPGSTAPGTGTSGSAPATGTGTGTTR